MKAPVVVVVVVAVLVLAPAVAVAYPQYQFASDTATCGECHQTPAGGGLLTEWGRGELGDTLSMGGDGRLLHAIDEPEWLAVGGGLRLAALVNDTGSADGAETAVFPMQAELAARLASGALSITAIAGARSAARDTAAPDDDAGGFGGLAFFSREHFVGYHDEASAWWLRAGRFTAPFGLRLADHTAYVRRHTGYGVYEETYGVGASRLVEARDLHLTAFISDVLQVGAAPEAGVAGMLEQRWAATAVVASTRITAGAAKARVLTDVAVKHWLAGPRLLWMAELAGGWEVLRAAGEGRPQLVGYAGPTWFPARGVNVGIAAELFAEDARVVATNRYAGSLSASIMPVAHVELIVTSRYQRVGTDDHALATMLQLHYLP
jgi:hypothetical protein